MESSRPEADMSPRGASQLVGLLFLMLAWTVVAEARDIQPGVGHRAPRLTLRDPEGKAGHPRERAVFLNFWATWCPPCREEMPTMERAHRGDRVSRLGQPGVPAEARGDREVVMSCHFLLLPPLAIAGLFVVLPWTIALPLAAFVAVPTALIGYGGWQALRQPVVTRAEALRGRRGEAASDLDREGVVRLRDELWLGEASQPLAKGQPVEVVEVAGARVRVRPWA